MLNLINFFRRTAKGALAERAVQVLKDSQQIAEFRWDPETTADLYCIFFFF